jgi:hypothetical protein
MALAGVNNLQQLKADLLTRETPLAPAHLLSAFPLLTEGY